MMSIFAIFKHQSHKDRVGQHHRQKKKHREVILQLTHHHHYICQLFNYRHPKPTPRAHMVFVINMNIPLIFLFYSERLSKSDIRDHNIS